MADTVKIIHNEIQSQAANYIGIVYTDIYAFLTVTIGCDFDVTYFPFDTQTCPIVFDRLNGFQLEFQMGKSLSMV